MALLDWFKRKAVTTDEKYLWSSRDHFAQDGKGKAPPFSMRESVNDLNSWVYAAAMLNAQAVASVPLRLYVRSDAQGVEKFWKTRQVNRTRKAYLMGDCERKPSVCVIAKSAQMGGDFEEIVDAHPLLELLRSANRSEDGFGLSVMRILFLELTGNAYLHVVMDEALGVPAELWTMPAQHVTVVPGKERLVDGFLYGANFNAMQSFEPDEVIHFKRPNPRSMHYGMGKVEAAYGAIRLNQAAHEQDIALAENMSRPDYVAIIKGGGGQPAMDRLEAKMKEMLRGKRRTGNMAVVSGDIDIVPLSFPNKDLNGRDEIVEEIAAVFGVPVSMLKANDPNLASAQSGYAMWRESTVAPICRMDEETLNARLLPLFGIDGDAYLAYDDPVPVNRVADAAERMAAVAGKWRTANEARIEEGYEPLDDPDADKLHIVAPPVSPFGVFPTRPASEVKTVEPVELHEDRILRIESARIKIASIEAKAWEAVHVTPKLAAMETELLDMRKKTTEMTDIIAALGDALEASE